MSTTYTLPPGLSLNQKKAIASLYACSPCCSGSGQSSSGSSGSHGNPGCCQVQLSACSTCYRYDYSWVLTGCTMFGSCVSGTAFVQDKSSCGGGLTQSTNVTDASNFDTSDACSAMGLGTGTIGAGVQAMCYNSNLDPLSGQPIDKTLDAWYFLSGFTCFDNRMQFCAIGVFYQGVTPAPAINPTTIIYFNQDVLQFATASCDPFSFSVANLGTYQIDRLNGLGAGPHGALILNTSPCSGTPRISATWTSRCNP